MTLFCQFQIMCSDQSLPEKSATTRVTIEITRDEYPPTIDFDQYNMTIDENYEVDQEVKIRIIATDRDMSVSIQKYLILIYLRSLNYHCQLDF